MNRRRLTGAPGRVRGALSSVRIRVTVMATVVVAIAFAAGGVGLVLLLERSLEQGGDAADSARVRDLAALVRADGLPTAIRATGEEDFAQVVGPGGEAVASSPGLGERVFLGSPRSSGAKPSVRTVDVVDAGEREPFRVWTSRVGTPEGTFFVHVGSSLEAAREAKTTLRAFLLAGLPPLTVLLAVGAWLAVGRALRPVEAIRAEVADVSAAALDRRVPVPAGDDEIARLARTMNGMLDRLEAASHRQRAFVADASHELQSPLTALRAELEVTSSHPDRVAWRQTVGDLLADVGRMEQLVRDLLFLASKDEAGWAPASSEVDLDVVVLEEAARLRMAASVSVDTSGVSAAPLRGSSEQLTRLVRNLLENATRHARTAVRVGLRTHDGMVRLVVDDDGPGVPVALREQVFGRFVRVDAARGRSSGGAGLGLAIVREIAHRHGGSVSIGDSDWGGARLVVVLVAEGGLSGSGSP